MKIALAGNPNCGKTTLFNALTGATAHVGNWAGVTVEKLEGVYKDKKNGIEFNIVDLPGIYSLSPYTPEEIISRNYIMSGDADIILNIVDATNLERNMYLTTQLLETQMPMVVALNMTDSLKSEGKTIDTDMLSQKLGVPVLSISALKQKGLKELMQAVKEQEGKTRNPVTFISRGILADTLNEVLLLLDGKKDKLFDAVKLVEGDKLTKEKYKDILDKVDAIKATNKTVKEKYNGDYEACVADCRYAYINEHLSDVVVCVAPQPKLSKSDKIDKVLTHRFWGIPIFLLIILAVFHITFSENFLYLSAVIPDGAFKDANTVASLFVDTEYEEDEDGNIKGANSIKSPGVFLQGLVERFADLVNAPRVVEDVVDDNGEVTGQTVIEEGGWIPRLLKNAPEWTRGIICDGVLSGVFGVISFLPQILVLFLFLTILEDTGYMARVAFIMDRAFRKIGLSGKSFMPLLMCFGCAVPGIMATRTIENDRERRSTILLAPFFSCGAKSPIWFAFAAVLATTVGWNPEFTVFGVYLVGIAVAVIAALILKKLSGQKGVTPFIMELPTYHAPQFKSVAVHIWQKLKHFLFRAGTVIAASTVVIWFLLNFNFSFRMVGEDQSILATVGGGFEWLFVPLGFGNWKFIVASVTGLIAKEEVISSIEVLAGSVEALITESGVGTAGIFAYMAFNLLTIPCMATVGAAAAEFGSAKKTALALLFWLATSYIVAMVINLVGTYWWTAFIFAFVIAVLLIAAHFLEKCRHIKTLQADALKEMNESENAESKEKDNA